MEMDGLGEMARREFLRTGVAAGFGLALRTGSQAGGQPSHHAGQDLQPTRGPVRARDVHRYLLRLGRTWVDPEATVDTFKAGDPESVVRGIAVGWMPYTWALRRAIAIGCNLFIAHEPLFYDHQDDDPSVFDFEAVREKKDLIERNGLIVLRCHDVWDRMPGLGVRDAWASFLGLRHPLQESEFCRVYRVERQRAIDFARYVAACVSKVGEDAVQLVGPPEKYIRSVAIGTGAITPFRHMVQDLRADLCVCTDDGFTFWRDGALAIDMGVPVVVVHHGCAEEFGMKQLALHLIEAFPDIPVHHIPQKCMFRTVRS